MEKLKKVVVAELKKLVKKELSEKEEVKMGQLTYLLKVIGDAEERQIVNYTYSL